ncbi:MAG: VOC family protein, partial [Kordiimonadaceae bacterium]|nr:VOC family protein [Kordiimonadaceae bacterium]
MLHRAKNMGVSQLGYIGIAVTDPEAWLDIATSVLGMQVRPQLEGTDVHYLRLDDMHHRFALYPSDKDDVLYAGWQVPDEQDLEEITATLNAAGITTTEGSAAECSDRQVFRLVKFLDPEGYANELFVRPVYDALPFHPSLPISGFVAGDLGLGHIVRHYKDHHAMTAFYRDTLGFKTSDHITTDDLDATFMHCNPRHHSFALINEAIGHVAGDTNHFMIEVKSISDVGRLYDIVVERKFPIIMTLGEHSNDHTMSFYFVSPSGFGIEVGT